MRDRDTMWIDRAGAAALAAAALLIVCQWVWPVVWRLL